MTQEEQNKATLNRFWEEVWDQGNLDVVDEIFHTNFVDHGLAPGLTKQGPEGAKEAVMQFREAMPDLYLKAHQLIAEGDKVLTLWESGGTQTGPLKSARGVIPPSGKRGIVRGMTLNRVEDGKIIEAWDNFDILGMLQQLGVIPSGPPGGGPPKAGDGRG
ncbi:MAG: ester cyclase [Actinobacteria bacterium]|nr:MAG: ester cyclase [Actinomycetota bacterium]